MIVGQELQKKCDNLWEIIIGSKENEFMSTILIIYRD